MIDQLKIMIHDPESLGHNKDRFSIFEIQKPDKQQQKEILRLLRQPGLSLDELLKILYFQYDSIGIHDFSINKLYNYNEGELNFFMTQLCYLCIQRGSLSLEKFLVDKSATTASFFTLVRSIIDAYSVNMKLTKEEERNLQKLKEDIEKSYVNGVSSRNCLVGGKDRNTQDIIKASNEKGARIDYVRHNDSFLNNMVNYSLLLKGIEKPDQKAKLKEFMDNENFWILNTLRKASTHLQYEGITIPFRKEYKSKYHSTLVVRIISDEVTCFNTRTRVPYRVAIETIDIEELKQYGRTSRESFDNPSLSMPAKQQFQKTKQFVEQLAQAIAIPTPKDINKQKSDKYNTFVDWAKEKVKEEEIEKEELSKSSVGHHKAQPPSAAEINKQNETMKNVVNIFVQNVKEQRSLKQKDFANWAKLEEIKEEEERKTEDKLPSVRQLASGANSQVEFEPQLRMRRDRPKDIEAFNKAFPPKQRIRSISVGKMSTQKLNRFRNILKTGIFQAKTKKRSKSVRHIKSEDLVTYLSAFPMPKKSTEKQREKIQDMINYLKWESQATGSAELDSTAQANTPNAQGNQRKSKKESVKKNLELTEDDKKSSTDLDSDPVRKLEPWGEYWEDKKKVIRSQSEYGKFKSYKCRAVIFKGGDDLRQEILAMQLIYKFQKIFMDAGVKAWLRPYEILVISSSSGILEFLPDTLSIDALKKKVDGFTNMYDFYQATFGDDFDIAQKNFIESLAGYSIVSYLLQFKDRHNGNILINNEGRLIHIDFGFMFSISPGNMNWENAPFKLTKEYVQLMGGLKSDEFSYYKDLVFMGFQAILEKVDEVMFMVQIMQEESDLPCFKYFDLAVFRQRFREDLKNNDAGLRQYVDKLINDSNDNRRTNLYDYFQLKSNGIRQ